MGDLEITTCFGALNRFAGALEAHARVLHDMAMNASMGGSEDAASFDSEQARSFRQTAAEIRTVARPLQAAEAMNFGIDHFPRATAQSLARTVRGFLEVPVGAIPEPELRDPDYRVQGILLLRELDRISAE